MIVFTVFHQTDQSLYFQTVCTTTPPKTDPLRKRGGWGVRGRERERIRKGEKDVERERRVRGMGERGAGRGGG